MTTHSGRTSVAFRRQRIPSRHVGRGKEHGEIQPRVMESTLAYVVVSHGHSSWCLIASLSKSIAGSHFWLDKILHLIAKVNVDGLQISL